MNRPTVGIFGLTSCAGCQLSILNCEEELLAIAGALDIRDFLMAASGNDTTCPLDIALVEGSIVSKLDETALRAIRARARTLVAIGTCAVCGGIARSSGARPLKDVVKVDLNIPGCPIEKDQFLASIAMLLHGDTPLLPEYPVCTECRMRENNCLLTEEGRFCCGPLTVAGCHARCPSYGVPCVGCRGPTREVNDESAANMLEGKGFSPSETDRRLQTFAPIGVAS
jgi:coenzyme F420-reducing hydrogenase gamma subunit